VTIVQPRAPHRDGRIRSDEFHIADLVEWTTDLVAAMRRSAQAMADVEKIGQGHVSKAGWDATHLYPGPWCKFCGAKPTCPALEKAAMDAAGVWFDDLDQPRLANDADADDPAKLSRDLDMLDMIEGWCNARRERAHHLAESGVEIPNYILVPKQGREKWNEGADAEVVKIATAAGLKPDVYQNTPKLRTPKQVRAAVDKLGKKDVVKALLDLSSTPEAGTNLVRADKTTRQAVPSAVNKHFSAIE
jgi:hypothetical protein